ncbi:MAG: hypothetical protein KJ042_04930 [Deltaproteobacteria bacterium]|nr:hypothetical protein [Deltaproteobacteria bacterium]
MSKAVSARLLLALCVLFAMGGASTAWAQSYPGGHGLILIMPDPHTALSRGLAFGGSVYQSGGHFPTIQNIGNVVQTNRVEGSLDVPVTLLQKDDWDNDAVDVTAKGTWINPHLLFTYPFGNRSAKSYKGRGVILGEIDYVNDKSEVDAKGKGNNADQKTELTRSVVSMRAGGSYGILEQWGLGAGFRFLLMDTPELNQKTGDNKLKSSGDPGSGLFAFELGTVVEPINRWTIGLWYEAGASDNPKIKIKGENENGQKVDDKTKIYRAYPAQFGLGTAYKIKQADNLQITGDYIQRQNLEKDDIDVVLRRQTFAVGANYPINGMWTIRGGLNKADESGDGKLSTLGLCVGAGADVSKEFDVDMNLGYFTGKEEVNDDDDAKYQDIRLGVQGAYRFK